MAFQVGSRGLKHSVRVSKAYSGTGWAIPAGSLDIFAGERANAAARRVEVLAIGDSVTYGQTTTGTYYSWVQKLRELAQAAGWPDGGMGMVNGDGPEFSVGDNVDTITNEVQTNPGAFSFGICGIRANAAAGETITYQGKGTRARLYVYAFGSVSSDIGVSIDGGAETVYEAATAHFYDVFMLNLGSYGTHTVTLTNKGGRWNGAAYTGGDDSMFALEFLRSTGVVFQNGGISGISADQVFQGSQWPNGVLDANHEPMVRATFGMNRTNQVNPPYLGTVDPDVNTRKPSLAIIHLGTNDQQQLIGAANFEGAMRTAIASARAAGADPLVIRPQLEQATNSANSATYYGVLDTVIADSHVAWCDFGVNGPLGPTTSWVGKGYVPGLNPNPHLMPAAYQAQAQFLWDNILSRY